MSKWFVKTIILATAFSSCLVFAAPPVVQSQADAVNRSQSTANARATAPANEQALSEMLYQMQQMQQELMTLRGMVEELSYQLQQSQQLSKDRYIDLDRRISDIRAGNIGTSEQSSSSVVSVPDSDVEQKQYDQAKDLIRQKKYDDAVAAFTQYINDYPDSSYTPNAWYWMGEVYLVLRETEKAKGAFQAVVDQYPDHQKYPDSLYKLATCYAKLDDVTKARELFEKVIDDYPGSQIAGKASVSLKNLN
ncbi:tol-pal system protein YbgF [Gynuella sp.]|uniref:tol-pal system protein YbgF n=1 Tax=Gynuella sp. TaxID=2969146 RepID=UPI003D15185E